MPCACLWLLSDGRSMGDTGRGRRTGPDSSEALVRFVLLFLLRRAPDEIAEDRESEDDAARLRDQPRDAAVREEGHFWLSTQSPPVVNRTIRISIGYCAQSASFGDLKIPTARSWATASPATWPATSAATSMYQ